MGRWPVLLIVAGCAVNAHPPPAAQRDAGTPEVELVRPFAVPGEAMEYGAELRGLSVGRVVTAIGKLGWVDGRRAVIVKSRGQSSGMIALFADLIWEQTSTIDVDHGHVISAREESWAVLAGNKEHDDDSIGDEGAHDIHSAVAAVRAWRSLPGQRASLDIRIGGTSIQAEIVDAGHGFLASAHEPAVRYDGIFDGDRHFTAWVSDDIARVPLRFECTLPTFGLLVLELVHYTAPTE